MTPGEEYCMLIERVDQICREQGWGDAFAYARSKEIQAAYCLGHEVADTYSGADAFNKNGEPVEYKSTTSKYPKGAYTGISVQPTWPEQRRYLFEEKIAKYKEHYFNRFKDGKLVESWKMSGLDVYNILLPKFEKKYPTVLSNKDPRLSANVSWTEIKKHGTKVL